MIGQGESPSAPTMSVVMPWAILRFREGILHETVLGVVVNIDEAGGEDEAVGVDGRLVFFGLQFPDADDVARSDAHVRFVERRAGAIGNARVGDEEGARPLRGEKRQEGQGGEERDGDGSESFSRDQDLFKRKRREGHSLG